MSGGPLTSVLMQPLARAGVCCPPDPGCVRQSAGALRMSEQHAGGGGPHDGGAGGVGAPRPGAGAAGLPRHHPYAAFQRIEFLGEIHACCHINTPDN